MSRFAQSVTDDASYRWALALALALALHGVLLFGVSINQWTFRFPAPQQFEVVLLPPETAMRLPTPKLTSKPASNPNPDLVPMSKPESVSRPDPKPEPASKLEPKPTPKPAPKLTTKPTPGPISKSDPKPAPKPVPKPVPKSVPKPVSKRHTEITQPPPKPAAPVTKSKPTRAAERPAPPLSHRSAAIPPLSGQMSSTALLSQVARLETESQRQKSATIRMKRVTLTDTRSIAGFYAADWARKVTRVGEMNFPDTARRLSLSAGPLLEVAIRADGSLLEVRILHSSGNAELDRAAQRIVKLAAPYPPFPAELHQQANLLRIESPWRFDPGGRVQAR